MECKRSYDKPAWNIWANDLVKKATNPHFKLDSQNDTPDSLGGKSKREGRIKQNATERRFLIKHKRSKMEFTEHIMKKEGV